MKYFVVCLGLISLTAIAAEGEMGKIVNVQNRSDHNAIIYYIGPDNLIRHKELTAFRDLGNNIQSDSDLICVKNPSSQAPQTIAIQIETFKKQYKLSFAKQEPISINPAFALMVGKKIQCFITGAKSDRETPIYRDLIPVTSLTDEKRKQITVCNCSNKDVTVYYTTLEDDITHKLILPQHVQTFFMKIQQALVVHFNEFIKQYLINFENCDPEKISILPAISIQLGSQVHGTLLQE